MSIPSFPVSDLTSVKLLFMRKYMRNYPTCLDLDLDFDAAVQREFDRRSFRILGDAGLKAYSICQAIKPHSPFPLIWKQENVTKAERIIHKSIGHKGELVLFFSNRAGHRL